MSIEEINQLFERAIKAGKNRDYNTAIDLLTQIINNYDYPVKTLLYLGRAYHAIGDLNRAIGIFNFFLKHNPSSIPGHFFLGRTFLTLGIYKQSIVHLKAALNDTKSPYYFLALNLIAIAFLKAKRPGISATYFEKALKIEPDNQNIYTGYLNALLVKAIKLYRNNELEESAQIFEFLLKNRKDTILPHLYLARIYRLVGADQKALSHYEAASEMSPDDPSLKLQKAVTLLKLGNRKAAEQQLINASIDFRKEAVKIINPYQLLRIITMRHFKQENYRKAIYYAKEILKENYADIEMHVVIAEAYLKLGDLEKAKNHYLRSIERDKNRIQLYYGLFNVLWEKREYEELIKMVKRVVRINPDDQLAEYFYALCYSQTGESPEKIFSLLQKQIREKGPDPLLMTALGQAYLTYDMPELAENWFLRTLKIKTGDEKTLYLLIVLYHHLKKPKKQKEYFEKYLHINPEKKHVRKKYAKLLIRLENYSKAIQEILSLLPVYSKQEDLKKMLAYSYMKIKNYKEAIITYKELLQYKPDSIDYLKSLIICLESAGNRKYAIALVEKALSFFKRNNQILFILAGMYYRDGDNERAIKIFKEVLAEDPYNWIALKNIGQIYKETGNKIFANKFLKRAENYRKGNK